LPVNLIEHGCLAQDWFSEIDAAARFFPVPITGRFQARPFALRRFLLRFRSFQSGRRFIRYAAGFRLGKKAVHR